MGANTEYRKLVITDRNWDCWRFPRPSTIAVEYYRIMIWSVKVPRKVTAYWCLNERGDKGKILTKFRRPVKEKHQTLDRNEKLCLHDNLNSTLNQNLRAKEFPLTKTVLNVFVFSEYPYFYVLCCNMTTNENICLKI